MTKDSFGTEQSKTIKNTLDHDSEQQSLLIIERHSKKQTNFIMKDALELQCKVEANEQVNINCNAMCSMQMSMFVIQMFIV